MKILAVIPARAGSKGIPSKNLRLLNGKPLIRYILEVAAGAKHMLDDVIVTSESPDILEYCSSLVAITRSRPKELSNDEVTLDPVVYDAVLHAERVKGVKYDIVVTLQPTSPALKTGTLIDALTAFVGGNYDTCISVVDDTHLKWQLDDGTPLPLYQERANRQWLPKVFKETGAFVISKRKFVTKNSRMGDSITLYPLNHDEAVDVDTPVDWVFAEAAVSRRRIAIVVKANKRIGMGHVYRALTIADSLLGNPVKFFSYDSDPSCLEVIDNEGHQHVRVDHETSLERNLAEYRPDIIINDILDTNTEFISRLKCLGSFVVNFEDLGEGSDEAHLVFNALYDVSSPPPHHRFGPKYFCLNRNFMLFQPVEFHKRPSTLLITFGGVDENKLTLKALKLASQFVHVLGFKAVVIILGPGFDHKKAFATAIESLDEAVKKRIRVCTSVDNMARLIRDADVAITSNGRTVYELAAMGIPTVSMAQNDRETLHSLARYSRGVKYLGIGSNVSEETLFESVREISLNNELRLKMRQALLAANLRDGLDRVKDEILTRYSIWKDQNIEPVKNRNHTKSVVTSKLKSRRRRTVSANSSTSTMAVGQSELKS